MASLDKMISEEKSDISPYPSKAYAMWMQAIDQNYENRKNLTYDQNTTQRKDCSSYQSGIMTCAAKMGLLTPKLTKVFKDGTQYTTVNLNEKLDGVTEHKLDGLKQCTRQNIIDFVSKEGVVEINYKSNRYYSYDEHIHPDNRGKPIRHTATIYKDYNDGKVYVTEHGAGKPVKRKLFDEWHAKRSSSFTDEITVRSLMKGVVKNEYLEEKPKQEQQSIFMASILDKAKEYTNESVDTSYLAMNN